MNNLLELKNISKSFITETEIKVLKKLSFTFKKGKVYSLMGPSGAGKSTLLNLISLIDRPSSGVIKFNNQMINFDKKNKNDLFRAKNIGIIYQQNNLLPDFTALENVYLASLSNGTNKDIAKEKAKDLLKKVGLSNRMGHFPSQLSGGESQRVAIVRAIINEPSIILADEPTGSLDSDNAKLVFKILFNLKNKNRIIIFATHNRYFANMADCKITMNNGNMNITNASI